MARLARVEYEGAIYHVTVRGNNRRDLFRDDRDRERVLAKLAELREEFGIRLYVFCLMTNHVHFVLETPKANLGRFMHKLQTAYTIYFNKRHRESGHVTQGRYKAILVQGDEYLLKLARYVHLNPVFVAGTSQLPLRERIAILRAYRWSSYPHYAGKQPWSFVDDGPLLAMMNDRGARRKRAAFQRFVEAGLAETDEEFRQLIGISPLVIGGEDFRDRIQGVYRRVLEKRTRAEDVSLRKAGQQVPVERVLAVVCHHLKVDVHALRRRRRNSWVRPVAARALTWYAGLNQRETAEVLEIGTGKAVSVHLARLATALSADRGLRNLVAGIDRDLAQDAQGDSKS
jgi:putative transposase